MLSVGMTTYLIGVPLFSYRISPSLFNRSTIITLLYSALLSYHAYHYQEVGSGIGVFNGLLQITTLSQGSEFFIFLVGAFLLLGWASYYTEVSGNKNTAYFNSGTPTISEYSLMILFTTIGATLLVSSFDLVTIFLSIELQSFAVYVLATLYKNSESATAAGLKYFLLGGLSSALILLGTGFIYISTGQTQFEGIYQLVSQFETVPTSIIFGMLLIGVGFLFKVAAAPFHNWAPDVYDGTPTIVTSWLSTIPKISIFVFLLEILTINIDSWKTQLLIASLFSLILGTVLGLSQTRIKRLLTYSTISHVGFLLLALAINSQESIESFLFYLAQYSITNLNVFLVLLAFGYMINRATQDITFIQELKGQFNANPLLSVSFALSLFSIAGIPPLIGFFAKQKVLYASIHGGYYFMSIVAIIVSVISASYYLKIVQVIYFYPSSESPNFLRKGGPCYAGGDEASPRDAALSVTNMHSILIATLTMFITLFVFQPTILLNACHLLALSLFYY